MAESRDPSSPSPSPDSHPQVQDEEAPPSRPASPTPPPRFNFTQPATHTPETAFFETFNASTHHATQRNIRAIGLLFNSRQRASAQAALRNGIGMSTTYIDQDESGNYDPSSKRERAKPRPAKRQKKLAGLNENGVSKPKQSRNRVGYRNLMTFKFTTKAGLDYLRSITPDPLDDPVYSTEEESDSDDDSDSSDDGPSRRKRRNIRKPERLGVARRDDGMTLDDITIGHIQRRGCKSCFLSGNDDCSLIDDPFAYPCEACEDVDCDCELITPPEFKDICARCKHHKLECSYEDDGGKDQDRCQACEEEDVPCCAGPMEEQTFTRRIDQVISRTPQERKALAAQRKTTPPPPERKRRFVSCNQCRDQGLRCNLKGKSSTGPCRPCRLASRECAFVWAPTQLPSTLQALVPSLSLKVPNKYGKKRSSTPDPLGNSQESGESLSPNSNTKAIYGEMERKHSRQQSRLEKRQGLHGPGKQTHLYISKKSRMRELLEEENPLLIGSTLGMRHIHITTSFCHPIKFNYIPPPDFPPVTMPDGRRSKHPRLISPPDEPCHFCENKFFGLTGLCDEDGPKTVEGFYYPDGSGFEEISGGYSELGHPSTKMCVPCTTSRIKILSCPAHKIRALQRGIDIDPRIYIDAEWDSAIEALKNGDIEGGKVVTEAKWCSICPSVASSKCCARQSQDDKGSGCGLLLCDKCDKLMEQIWKGGIRSNPEIIGAHIREMGVQSYRFPAPRADASFLTKEGELMVRMLQGMGQHPIEKGADEEVPSKTASRRKSSGRTSSFGGGSLIGAGERSRKKKVDKGKGKDWSQFKEEYRPKGWDEVEESSVEEDDTAEEVKVGRKKKYGKVAKPDGEIEFGGPLNEVARAKNDRNVEMAFGGSVRKGSVVDLTGDDD